MSAPLIQALSRKDGSRLTIIVVDSHDRIRDFLPQLDELVSEGLVILDDCQVGAHR